MPTNLPTPSAALDLTFEGKRVRSAGDSKRLAWIAQDVCDVLNIASASDALRDFEEGVEKGTATIRTLGGKQNLLIVYEPGLYRLVLLSRKPEAIRFRKWITGEVLPSIREYGVYPPPETFAYELTLKPYTARVVWVMQVRQRLPKGYWCVFIEGAEILIGAEHILGPSNLEMQQYDLLDGSMGTMWASYRQDQPWAGRRVGYEYTFPKDDPRGTVRPWAYPMQEIEHFKEWLHGEYWSVHFPAYLKRKYGAKAYQQALPIFASLGVPLLVKPKR